MSTIVDERRFGVEIECGLPGGCDQAEELLYNAPGLRHWVDGQDVLNGETGEWEFNGGHVHEDGSGVEISGPILQGAAGFDELRRVFELLAANGGYVTSMDGMHVHHDAPDFIEDKDAVVRIVEMWAANQEHIDTLVHRFRRDNGACPKDWTFEKIAQLKSNGERGWTRGALNVRALGEHGTIEFRQHEGTLDFNTAQSWIKFGQAFMASALRRTEPLLACSTPKELLYRIRADRMAAAVLLAKDTEGDVPTPNEPTHHDDYYCCEECENERWGVEDDGEW